MSNVFYIDDLRSKKHDSAGSDDESKVRIRRRILGEMKRRRAIVSATNTLQDVTPILLYHVSWGRNAWHSTWLSRYRIGTLAPSREDAKAFIVDNLKQGTAYCVTVMPGWFLRFGIGSYLVVEINTNKPFARLNCGSFLPLGILKDDAMALLDPASEMWTGSPPSHDSIVVQQSLRNIDDFQHWDERTTDPMQTRTPGPYKRVVEGSNWFLESLDSSYDTSAFEGHLE